MTSEMLRNELLLSLLALKIPLKDASFNPRYYSRFHFELDGQKYQLFVQRWCRGCRRGLTHYSRLCRVPHLSTVGKRDTLTLLQRLQGD